MQGLLGYDTPEPQSLDQRASSSSPWGVALVAWSVTYCMGRSCRHIGLSFKAILGEQIRSWLALIYGSTFSRRSSYRYPCSNLVTWSSARGQGTAKPSPLPSSFDRSSHSPTIWPSAAPTADKGAITASHNTPFGQRRWENTFYQAGDGTEMMDGGSGSEISSGL